MTTQPQPTEALSDAELIDAYRRAVETRVHIRTSTHRFSLWEEQVEADIRAELESRLARAESAPGVTIPTDIAIYAHTILGDMGPDEVDGDSWPTHVATVRILGDAIDAALADAGTEASE